MRLCLPEIWENELLGATCDNLPDYCSGRHEVAGKSECHATDSICKYLGFLRHAESVDQATNKQKDAQTMNQGCGS